MNATRIERARHGIATAALGLGINAVLAAAKAVAGVLGSSQALIADAVESATDIFGSLVVLGGIQLSGRPPDTNHPYGHGKAEPLATVLVAFALAAAALGIARESIRLIQTPHPTPAPFTLAVLVGVICIKEWLFRHVIRKGEALQSSVVTVDAWHHRSDALTSLAAFIGISIALWQGPGWESADDWAALFAAVIILVNAFVIARPAIHELMDRAPDPALESEIRGVAAAVPGVLGLHRCLIRKMGYDFYVDLDVIVDPHITVAAGHEIAHLVQDALKASNARIYKVLVHVEPAEG